MRSKKWNAKAIAVSILLCFTALLSEQTVGLFINSDEAYKGYTLFAPSTSETTYLIDMEGQMVHSWESLYKPGQSAYLLEDGRLLRTINYKGLSHIDAGGAGGGVQILDWDGTILWQYFCADSTQRSHHDVEMLPNGNVLMIAWERKTYDECIASGRDASLLKDGELWPDKIIEVKPIGRDSGEVVWEWYMWDHLVQDEDPSKDNYGTVADHPELLDINCVMNAQMSGADWNHTNGIDYNAELDQIIISLHNMNEFFIIDHSTTTEEAAGHSGGKSGMGGDILFRWGNPYNYGAAGKADQKLYLQHDAQWIPKGYPGEGNILVFNNGNQQKRPYSTVDEIAVPLKDDGTYDFQNAADKALWSYSDEVETDFYAVNISGAQRLPNGNTLICDGPSGRLFEVTQEGKMVWKYVNPVAKGGIITQGDPVSDNNPVFRCYRYDKTYAGFQGKELLPKGTIELGDEEEALLQTTSKENSSIVVGKNTILLPHQVSQIRLYTLGGKELFQKRNVVGLISFSQFPTGVYLATIETDIKMETIRLFLEN